MAFTFPAAVAYDPAGNKPVKNVSFQVYAVTDTAYTTPLAITDAFGTPLPGNILNSGNQGVFPQFQHATNATVVIADATKTYAWTVVSASNDATTASFINTTGSASALAVKSEVTTGATATQLKTTYGLSRSTDIRNKGAVSGTGDSSAAFLSAMTDAKNSATLLPFSLSGDARASVVIDIPAGVYTVTQLNGLIGRETMTSKAVGLKIRGAGQGLTSVVFNPSTAGALNLNDYWNTISFEGIDFYATIAGCTFIQSYTTHAAQQYSFDRCTWTNFKYIADLQGTNNNSEWIFTYCHAYAIGSKESDITSGAWLNIGASSTSDQFLNYWWYGCKFWSTSSPLINAQKGGSFHIFGMDCSDWGTNLTAPGYLFILGGTTHSYGVQNFEVTGLRVEAKNANAKLVSSTWPGGQVTFRNVDWSSQVSGFTYGDIINISYSNYDGAIYSFEDCVLAGGVHVTFSINDWQHIHSISFSRCKWLQKTSPSDVVSYTLPANNYWSLPPVKFIDCRGGNTDATVAAGVTVWDATISYRGDMVQTVQQRTVSVRDIYGMPSSGPMTVQLPVGALITGIEALSAPGGASTHETNGTYTLKTGDATPVTIASLNVTTDPALGYDVKTDLAIPFICDTTARATVTVTPTNVQSSSSKGVFLIKGYW